MTALDLAHGSVGDSATATGTPPSGTPITSAPSTLSLPVTALTVAKTVTSTGPYNTLGQTVSYQFVATNTGTTTLTGVGITDTQTAPAGSLATGPTCQAAGTAGTCTSTTVATLATGQHATFVATYTLTQADLDNGSVADFGHLHRHPAVGHPDHLHPVDGLGDHHLGPGPDRPEVGHLPRPLRHGGPGRHLLPSWPPTTGTPP